MNEHEDDRERSIVERSKQLFDESVRSLDGETRSKLAQARARAIEAAESKSSSIWPTAWLLPAGAVAAGVLAFALIWQPPQSGVELGPVDRTSMISDLDILLEEESLELFEELEFYAWLLEQPELADTDEAADGSG